MASPGKFGIVFFLICFSCVNREARETQFSIAHPESIFKIEISGKNKPLQVLVLKNDRWWLNDTIKVRPDAIENIMGILPMIRVKVYPPRAAWEFMIKSIGDEGVKVRFYNKSNHVVQSWLIGGTTNDERGTFAMIEGSKQPYVIHVPGFEGSLGSRFILNEKEWRDKMILEEPAQGIQSVQLEYLRDPRLSFKIEQRGKDLFTALDHEQKEIIGSVPLIKTYLEVFQKIPCEDIVNDFEHKDLVFASLPFAVLQVKIRNKPLRTIRFYTMESVGEQSMERMFVYDDRDFYLAQWRILQKLFRSIDYFKAK